MRKRRVCIITCYFQPDYVRARSLRAALHSIKEIDLLIVKNKFTGILRYPEILLRIVFVRLRYNPDTYLLTFRGQEILPLLLVLAWPKKIIFDEFVVPLAWVMQEGHSRTSRTRLFNLLTKASAPLYKWWLKSCQYILADTSIHAQVSSELSGVDINKYKVIPVSTDETLFKPEPAVRQTTTNRPFRVFFYGLKMTPLHGLEVILAAAEALAERRDIEFVIIGGNESTNQKVKHAMARGAHITYKTRVPFEVLPNYIHGARVCLGGPFGDTPQAKRVITGKTYQFLACAVPTIIGQNPAAVEFVDQSNCLMVPLGDPKALASKILWAYEHPQVLAAIGLKGRRLYEMKFSNQTVVRLLEPLVLGD